MSNMNTKEVNGTVYEAVKGHKGNCEGCVAHKSEDYLLCVELGDECTEEQNEELVWVLKVE